MAGMNGLAARLTALEELAPPLPPDPADEERFRQDWWDHAPAAVRQYMVDVDAEACADPTFAVPEVRTFRDAADVWFESHHPAAKDIVNGVCYAFEEGVPALPLVQGLVLSTAQQALGWALARARAAGKTGPCWDAQISEQMARRLYQASYVTLSSLRLAERLALWREAPMPNQHTLEMAGLHEAELRLLAADNEERST